MFVDKVKVSVRAGKGGDGYISFRHEKFVDRGGPDGGDGGDGGDVIVVASNNQSTLAAFRYKKLIAAESGQPGFKQKKHGKSGKSLEVALPVGTVIVNPDGEAMADLTEVGQSQVIANGGKGGFGNAHFVSSRRQAPRIAEKGEPGDEFEATFELKMIADVGLVGLPNAGKSTLLSILSNARPEIADYPFTTLKPNLGVVDLDKKTSLLLADIPGLIEGASQGKGLGDEFLRHIERTKALVHLIDIYNDDLAGVYKTIQKELADYRTDLSRRPQLVALNKVEGLDEEFIQDRIKSLQKALPKKTKVFALSAKSGEGIKELLFELKKLVKTSDKKTVEAKKDDLLPVLRLEDSQDKWSVSKKGKKYLVTGEKIERFGKRTDFGNDDGVQRLRDIMRKMGIIHELERQKINPGDKVQIGTSDIGSLEY